MKLKWQQAPVKTQWGDEMVVASVAIDNDHTLSLYCEREQTAKVDAMLAQRKPLMDEEIERLAYRYLDVGDGPGAQHYVTGDIAFARAIEAAHQIGVEK